MSPEADLRGAIEETYERLRTALARGDYELFRTLVDPAPSSPDGWDETVADLADSFPPLERTGFVALREAGEWAGYYFETDLEDAEVATLELIRFRRTASGWKLSGGPATSQIERSADAAATREAFLVGIRDDPFLKLPGEPGYEEE